MYGLDEGSPDGFVIASFVNAEAAAANDVHALERGNQQHAGFVGQQRRRQIFNDHRQWTWILRQFGSMPRE